MNVLKFITLLVGLFSTVLNVNSENINGTQENGDLLEMLQNIQSEMQQLQQETSYLKHAIEIQSIQETYDLSQIRAENARQEDVIEALEQTVEFLTSGENTKSLQGPEPAKQTVYNAYGCFSDSIALQCPNERRIDISTAIYGQYADTCTDECCLPGTSDCTETVPENSISDWLVLLQLCNNETSCEYVYSGAIINQCGAGYVADYMQISYNCLPEEEGDEVVGFTVYTTTSYRYGIGSIVRYDGVISNFGEHFDLLERTFTCPHNGVYMFEVGFHPYESESQSLGIYLDEEEIISMFADEIESGLNRASGFGITECSAGQGVNVRVEENNKGVYGYYKRTHFSGFMLYRLL